MGRTVEVPEVIETMELLKNKGEIIRHELRELREYWSRRRNDFAIRGEWKDVLIATIDTQYIPLLQAFENAYRQAFLKSRQLLAEFRVGLSDEDDNAVFKEGALIELERLLNNVHGDVVQHHEEANMIYRILEGEMGFNQLNLNIYNDHMLNAVRETQATRISLGTLNFDFSDLEDTKSEIEGFITRLEDYVGGEEL